jgi:membrane protein
MRLARPAVVMASRRRLRQAWRLTRRIASDSGEDRVLGLAAEMAFFAVLSVFPGLLIAVGLLGLLDLIVGPDLATQAKVQVVNVLEALLTERGADAVAAIENLFERRRGELLTFAALGALVTLSGAFAVIVEALNVAYDVPEGRGWIRRRLLGLALGLATVVAVVLALAALVVGPFLGTGQQLADLVGLGSVFSATWTVLRVPVVVVGLVAWAAALYHFAPNQRSSWRACLPGAVLTTVLWVIASLGLHVYLAVAAGTNPVIGAFGGGVIVMMWAYLLCLALLLGGELNAVLERRERRHTERPAGHAAAGPHPRLHLTNR